MEAEFLMGGYYGGGDTGFFPAEKRLSDQRIGGDHNHNFMVDDLLDFSNDINICHDDDHHDAMVTDGFLNINADITKNSYDHSSATLTAANTTTESCNSSSGYGHSLADSHFSNELCVLYDDMAELEWLSNLVEDSFSTDQNLQTNLHILIGSKPTTPESSSSETHLEPTTRNSTNPIFQPDGSRPGKARSKRSRVAPCDWSTHLLHLAPTAKPSPKKQEKSNPNSSDSGSEGVVRRCLHCASEKTPQWRTGPMGPKTLCNACGVRYKSGRLVPEYRPAASPTFVSAKHSNSHRKVVELRRQKEMQRGRQEQILSQSSIFGVSNGAEDYLFHHQSGPNFRHLI